MNLQMFINNGVDYQSSSVQADSELVQDIQRNLNRLGFQAGSVDGIWGRQTQVAFDRFQVANGSSGGDFTARLARLLLQPSVAPIPELVTAQRSAPAPVSPQPPATTPPAPVNLPTPSAVPGGKTATPSKTGQRINAEGLKLIKDFEGLRLEAYICPAGVPTIGYGSTAGVKMGLSITVDEAEALLIKDLERFEAAIRSAVTVPLTDNQFSSLVCFSFNVGTGAFRDSTLLRLLNQGDYQGAADQLLRWDKAGGKSLPGLQRRRQAERALFLKK
jgi:GH24 family phage-related lysozyme (muramidase)